MRYRKEDKVAWWLAGGAVLIIGGFLLSLMLYGAGSLTYMRTGDPSLLLVATTGPITMVVGVVAFAMGLRLGFKHSKPATGKEPLTELTEVFVVSRFAEIPGIGTWFTDFDTLEDPKTRFLVQLEMPDGEVKEYHCDPTVLLSVGEGMRGRALVQGGWLTQFTPLGGTIARNDFDRQLLPPQMKEGPADSAGPSVPWQG